MGFASVERIVSRVRAWQAGHVRALRSERARELMDSMLPLILSRIGGQPHPDETFTRFDRFLSAQPAGVQLLSLFQRNPSLLDRIAAVLGASPRLADHLAANASALEGLLSPPEEDSPSSLARRLGDARGLEGAIELTSRAVREEEFSIAVATMEGRLDVNAAGEQRAAMADAALTALLTPVLADFSERFGRVRGGGMVVVALGKAGGREMMAGSDLDLMFLYDHPPGVTESQGARTMPASQWFVRLAHAYVAALTAPGVEGHLYDVDMRLRPSGNKGPVAVSLEGFQRYHREDAWTWERMALTRARVIAGPPGLRARAQDAITAAIVGGGKDSDTKADADSADATAHILHADAAARTIHADAAARTIHADAAARTIHADAAAMRARMLKDLPPDGPWDVKHRPGGQIEVEFIAQVSQLAWGGRRPEVLHPTTREALRRLADAGFLSEDDAALLIRADHAWRTVQGMLRITVGRDAGETLPEASARPLLRAMGAPTLPALRGWLDSLAEDVRAAFIRHVGAV